jgi:hypothetical protein
MPGYRFTLPKVIFCNTCGTTHYETNRCRECEKCGVVHYLNTPCIQKVKTEVKQDIKPLGNCGRCYKHTELIRVETSTITGVYIYSVCKDCLEKQNK